MDAIDIIKQHISELGITQSELAEKSGLALGTINRILNCKQELKPNTLVKIADGLDLSVSDLEEERVGSFNYAVQGYLQFEKEITHITSFKQLQNWIKKYEPLINALPNRVKQIRNEEMRNARKVANSSLNIDISSIDFLSNETIDATKVETWSFRKSEDERDGLSNDIGNMCTAYPFSVIGRTFTNSEALYICGLFSNNTDMQNIIQTELIQAKSGHDAKKEIRRRFEKAHGREDWETFNVEYMKWCVWQKIKGNEDFRKVLMAIPRNASIIENSTRHTGATASFWGMKNKELEKARSVIEECIEYNNPTAKKKDLAKLQMEERNKINHIGVWEGVNCMGKILKYMQLCLLDSIEPQIDYDLLRSKEIYLFGELLTFTDEASLVKKPNKVVIFDFDGTLLDTRPLVQYEYLFKQPQRGSKEWEQGRKEYLSHVRDCPLWDGMDEVIEYIRQNHIPTCIVTANTKDRVKEAIKVFGWEDVFKENAVIGCYALGVRRISKEGGDPSMFLKALKVLGLEASDCVAFGNEINDTLAANATGIEAYNCLWGASEEERLKMSTMGNKTLLNVPIDILKVISNT